MKFLFLDIDGVLNSSIGFKTYNVSNPWFVEDDKVFMLEDVINETDCYIVLTSTWRMYLNTDLSFHTIVQERYGIKHFSELIGDVVCSKIIGMTDVLDGIRGDEIDKWIKDNGVVNYAIIDDDADMLEYQMPCFVKTDTMYGMCESDKKRLINILNNKFSL